MAKYDFFISYSPKDRKIASILYQALSDKGYKVFFDISEIPAGVNFARVIFEIIADCDCFIPIITENYDSSKYDKDEMFYALKCSEQRAKSIIPLLSGDYKAVFDIAKYPLFRFENPENIYDIVDKIDELYGYKLKSAKLYEKLTEYTRLKYSNQEALTICDLIELICQQYSISDDLKIRMDLCKELYRLYSKLKNYTGSYDDESRNTAKHIINTLMGVEKLINENIDTQEGNIFVNDLYFCAWAIHIIWLDLYEIRRECADILSFGDAHSAASSARFMEKQELFVKAFFSMKNEEVNLKEYYSADDIAFIEETPKFIYRIEFKYDTIENVSNESRAAKNKQTAEKVLSEDDEILLSIANFMQEGNRLFDVLQKKGLAGDFLKCLVTSYERLKKYCEIIGAKDVVTNCIERIDEIRTIMDKQEKSAMTSEKAEKGIRSLLGFTLPDSGDYDVFISFKSEDADLAEQIYQYCQRHLKEPFWSKKSLPELSKSEYEDAIYNALRKSKHFIVVLSKLEYLKAKWIKKEMAVFDRAITEGRKENSNFLFVVTDDVYKEIIASNKMCLDERYCGYQIVKMSEYKDVLYKYFT